MSKDFDILIVGGGPAGMMAAISAREHDPNGNLTIAIVEKNESLGKKLLITGGGRCNVTNAQFDNRKLLEKFGDAGKFLFSTFSEWNSEDTINFFNGRGLGTKIENELRAFPITDSAQSVWNVLVQELAIKKIEIISNTPVSKIERSENSMYTVSSKNGSTFTARKVILATGGTSRPETGSTGDGYAWAKKLGHTIHTPIPSLVPLKIKDTWIKNVAGVSLPLVKITTFQFGKKCQSVRGKILFTHVGVSGPTILNMSKHVGELLGYGDVIIELDLVPELDYGKLNQKLQDIFKVNANKMFKNSIGDIVPTTLAPIIVKLSGINPEIQCNSITREERLHCVKVLKHLQITVDSLLGTDKAIITSGGVELTEIDFKKMESLKSPGLYIVGDMLNINRPSGGYSLQLCWTTGFVAGQHAARQALLLKV